ncbi:hypothetical protein ACJQWK_02846 [Exserohilum turcicum]
MLSDRDPNGGGRTSRASNVSALSRTSGKTAQRPPSSDFPALVGRGVSSMLRTETEMGNVGGVVLDDLSGVGSMHRTLQRHRAPSRMSTASSMSNTSSGASKHFRGYPSSSSAPRHSTGPHGPQYVANVLTPPMPNGTAPSSFDELGNRSRDPQRSRSMTNSMHPPYALSSNRSLTSLRPAHGSHPQNPYVYPGSYGAGLMPMNSNHRPISPALSDNTGMRPRASHRLEDQRLSNGGYGQAYANMGRAHRKRGQQNGGQGQQYRGLGNPHNVGQMRTRLPSQPSLLSLEDRREEEDNFPPYDGMAYDEQIEGLHSGNPHLRRDRVASRYHDYRSEAPPLPANHKHRIAVEHARCKRPAPGSVSSGSTNLRADSDVPSSDMTSPPTPRDGTHIELLHNRDGTKAVDLRTMGSNKLIVSEEKTSVAYYDYSEQFDHDEYAQPDTRAIPTGFVDRTVIEQCVPASGVAALNSDSFLEQEAQPMSMVVVSPNPNNIANHHANVATCTDNPSMAQPANIAELPASPVARRITRDLILKGLEASTTGDIQSLAKSPNTSVDSERTQSVDLPVKPHSAADGQVRTSLHSAQNKENRYSILSQAGSSILDSSTLNFAVRHSIPVATNGGFGEEVAREFGRDANMAASPGRSTEDGMTDVLAGYQGGDSKCETDLLRNVTNSEKKTHAEEHTATGTEDVMKPLPLVIPSTSNHAHKPSDDQSFKSCTDMLEEPSGRALSDSQKDCVGSSGSATDTLRKREEHPKESGTCSFSTTSDAVGPDCEAFVPPSRLPLPSLGTMVMKKNKTSSDVSSGLPAVVPRKQPPVPRRESSFSTVANKLRPNSKTSVRKSSLSASGSSSTLSTTHPSLVVPQRDSSVSKEAQRVHAAVSFLMRPLPSRFAKGLKRADADDTPKSDETVLCTVASPQDTNGGAASKDVPVSPSTVDAEELIEKVSLTPTGVPPKTRVIRFDPPEADNQHKAFGNSPAPEKDQQTPGSMSPVVPEPSSVYSIQDHSSPSHEEACPHVVPTSSDSNRRDSQTTTHLEWHHYGQPCAAPDSQQMSLRPSNGIGSHLDSLALAPLTNSQEDSTTDLRLSRYRYPGPSRYLPDLKEESHEDSSLNTSASNLKSSSFRYPFGAPSGIRASGEDLINFSRRSSSRASCRRSGVDSSVGGALAQTHGLPSMRFSRINLFDGLSDDLGLRYSRSMEEVAHVSQRLSRANPPRPASAGDVKGLQISLAELEEVERSRMSMQPNTMMGLLAMHGARSPEFMAEIERLTIPSVGGLTQRFSEFFPSLREYYKCGESAEFPVEEEIEKHAIEEIHEVHPTQKRSSARLRPIRGVSHMVVIDDDLYEEMTGKEKGKEKEKNAASAMDEGAAATDASGAGSIGGESEKGKGVTTPPTQHETAPLPKLQGPSPVFLRPRSNTVNLQGRRHSGESALSSRRSLRSFVSTPTATETRPWNSDKNYPWTTSTNPSIDISLPPPTAAKHSPRPGPSHLRNRLSEASSASSFSTAQTATASPFGSPADSTAHARQHRFSSFGRSNDQPHEVGERYPTSALSPPTAIFRDHLSASDTSDDEYYDTSRKTRLSLRKRFSSSHKTPPESTGPSAASIVQDSAGEAQAFSSAAKANRHTFRDAEGMRAADYRKQRIIDCLKTWWHKSSRLIRHLSIRKDSNTTSA